MSQRFMTYDLPTHAAAIIGVSGGPDSLCLLDLARQISSLDITVAHFNHKLRPEADREAEIVRQVAEQMGLAFVTDSADVQVYASENRLSLEEAARLLRYRFLFAQARIYHAGVVAVGHTADDQVETILMHFLRGAGLAGLKGMAGNTCPNEFDREIPLVRPILHLWRHETETYCHEHNLHPINDPSNTDETHFRNRLRHSLIPELEKYNPRFKNMLLRTAEALAGDYEVLADSIDLTWPKVVREAGSDYVVFNSSALAGIPRGLLRNIMRRGMELLRPKMRNLDFNILQRAADFITAPISLSAEVPPRKMDLSEGLYLQREADSLYLATLETDLPSAHWPLIEGIYELKINHQVDLDDTTSLSAFEVDIKNARRSAQENDNSFIAWMDADLTGDQFTVRTRHPGDRFKSLGMDGHTIKLSDLFVNVKLPERARGKWPLVIVGDEIAWVPGFRLAHTFRITEETKRVVRLTLQKK
jgi:tRNA(Ile)-lysidine synthetase, N-terminal domain/tRNA(Ile)-lysidine synthetase, C-terminal domain